MVFSKVFKVHNKKLYNFQLILRFFTINYVYGEGERYSYIHFPSRKYCDVIFIFRKYLLVCRHHTNKCFKKTWVVDLNCESNFFIKGSLGFIAIPYIFWFSRSHRTPNECKLCVNNFSDDNFKSEVILNRCCFIFHY